MNAQSFEIYTRPVDILHYMFLQFVPKCTDVIKKNHTEHILLQLRGRKIIRQFCASYIA